MTLLLGLLFAAAPADAQEVTGGASLMFGTSTSFNGEPATLRMSLRGEGELADAGIANLNFLLPVTIATQGRDGFGLSTSQTIIEIPPSLRLRLLPRAPIGVYGDMGAGAVIGTSQFGGWLFEQATSNVGFMTRFATGLEIGSPDGLSLIVEPISLGTYHSSQQVTPVLGAMIGLGARL